MSTRDAACAARMRVSASPRSSAIGFSTKTCLPAVIACMARLKCAFAGAAMATAVTLGSASAASKLSGRPLNVLTSLSTVCRFVSTTASSAPSSATARTMFLPQ